MELDVIKKDGFEKVVRFADPSLELEGIIAIHSTALGPAVGGCRMWTYMNFDAAMNDALRLAEGMTYKAAISGLNWGGGKSVILEKPGTKKSKQLLQAYARVVAELGGSYITAKDVGIGAEDLAVIQSVTPHVLGIEGMSGSSGDPSPATAFGVFNGIQVAAQQQFGTTSLKGRKIALQGLGSVAQSLLGHLLTAGAQVIACDISKSKSEEITRHYSVKIVPPNSIYEVACDVFAPCALGGVLNEQTIPVLKAKVVAGCANNQLQSDKDGLELHRRKILYAPDYVINAGGLINIYHESMVPGGYNRTRAFDHVRKIGPQLKEIFVRSEKENRAPHLVSNEIALNRVKLGRSHDSRR